MTASDYVHKDDDGRFVVADYRDGRYTGPMTVQCARLTGCSASYGSLADVRVTGYHYARHSDACRRARHEYAGAITLSQDVPRWR